jgi:hypothetical protein
MPARRSTTRQGKIEDRREMQMERQLQQQPQMMQFMMTSMMSKKTNDKGERGRGRIRFKYLNNIFLCLSNEV